MSTCSSSIIETLKKMDNKKLTDVVIADRGTGGDERLKAEHPHLRLYSIRIHAVHLILIVGLFFFLPIPRFGCPLFSPSSILQALHIS